MRRISPVVTFGLLLLALPALAQGANPGANQGGQVRPLTPPNAPKASDSAKPAPKSSEDLPMVVSLNARDCRRLLVQRGTVVQHQPDPGVTYQPGRDVDSQGRPIVPADLPGSANPLPLDGMIELPLRLPLSSVANLNLPQVPSGMKNESKLGIATVAVDPMTGKLAFNGKPLDPPAEDALAVACRDYLAKNSGRR